MTEIIVMSLAKADRAGGCQLIGYRKDDTQQRPVSVVLTRADAEELTRLAKDATLDDLLTIEVEDRAWSYVLPQVAA
jgi:hypothetical protein